MNVTNNLSRRAKFYSIVIQQLFISQQLSGFKLKQANRAARHLSLGLQLINPAELDKALKLGEAIALSSNTENVLAQRRAGLVTYQFQLAQGFWQSYVRSELPTPKAVGLKEKRKPVEFNFEQPHALIAGTTSSGKSETVKSILLSLMSTYSPDELRIILCDLHGDYQDFTNESHLVMPIVTSQDEIQNALLFANQELKRRKENNIKDDSILVLVIDEADKVLCDDTRLNIVQSLTQEGRKFGIHVLIATQKPSHKDLPNILDNLNNRFVGLVSDAKLSANLTGKSGLQCHLLTGRGDFIHTSGIDVERFQVALATRQDFDSLERCEVKPVEIEHADVLDLPAESKGGRPKLEVQPDTLAAYFHYGPQKISIAEAKKVLGLSRDHHNLHKTFCLDFIRAYKTLRGTV